jgi:hypothetical protein
MPVKYRHLLGNFNKAGFNEFSPKRSGVDYHIELAPESKPENFRYSPLYKMLFEKLKTYKAYLTDNFYKGFIETSTVP